MSVLLTEGKLGCRIIVERFFDVLIYVVPPIEELYDIQINLKFPNIKEHDIIISLVREFDLDISDFKKADTLSGFVLSSQSNDYAHLNIVDSALASIVDLSEITGVPLGTLDSIKTISSSELTNLPISDKFVIFNCSELSDIYNDKVVDGMLFIKFKHNISSHPSNHDGLLNFFDVDKAQFGIYVDGTDVPTDIDEYYSSYYIGYLFVPSEQTLKFGIDGDDACEIEIDGQVVCSWYGGHGFSGDPSAHSGTITLSPGWHRVIVRHEEIYGGDGVKAYIYDSVNQTWRLLTYQNIEQYFSGFHLKVPLYYTFDEMLQLFTNPPDTLPETISDVIKTNNFILFKTTSSNISSLKTLSSMERKVESNVTLLSGTLSSGSLDSLNNTEPLPLGSGVVLTKDSNGNPPSLRVGFQSQESLSHFILYIPTSFSNYYPYGGKNINIKVYAENGNEESVIKNIPSLVKNMIGAKLLSYDGETFTFQVDSDIDKSGYVMFEFSSSVKVGMIDIMFEDNIGEIRQFLFTKNSQGLFVIGENHSHIEVGTVTSSNGIKFEELNLPILNKTKIDKQVAYVADFIAFNDSNYILKLINNEELYTGYYTS